MNHYTLFQLNEYIRRTIALNFDDPIWIEAEIAQINFSSRHIYLELWQKSEEGDKVIAQSSAAIWADKASFIKKKTGHLFDQILQAGTKVLLKVQTEFHERYGFKLIILDLDPSFTLGQLAVQKEEAIEKLKKECLLTKNHELQWNATLINIAVLSSETSAGYQDFQEQLIDNLYGYSFHVNLFPIQVQGDSVRNAIQTTMDKIVQSKIKYDCIVLIRGGGSKMDLSAFDDYDLCASLAQSPFPIITGIGHERDESVADIVASRNLKTPTAVADFIIEYNAEFESKMLNTLREIDLIAKQISKEESEMMHQAETRILRSAITISESKKNKLNEQDLSLQWNLDQYIALKNTQLNSQQIRLEGLDPMSILGRGYSMTMQKNSLVDSIQNINIDEILYTHLKDGVVQSKIVK